MMTIRKTTPFIFSLLALFSLLVLSSCNDDDEQAPAIVITATDATFTIEENPEIGQVIGSVSASASRGEETIPVSFSIAAQSVDNAVSINATSGQIQVVTPAAFVFDTNDVIIATFEITAGDLTETIEITINITEAPDEEVPEEEEVIFQVSDTTFTIQENPTLGQVIGTLTASATRGEEEETPTFSISTQSVDGAVEIDATSGEITVMDIEAFDFETNETLTINAQVSVDTVSVEALVTINVTPAPVTVIQVSDTTFTIQENPVEGQAIGTLTASASKGEAEEPVTFSISFQSVVGAVAIDANSGELTVASITPFDFELFELLEVDIEVSAQDAESKVVNVIININDIDETTGFITSWFTFEDNETIVIPINNEYTYNYTIDWGDGTVQNNITSEATHTYALQSAYDIRIEGDFPAIYLNNSENIRLRIRSVKQWGDIKWKSMKDAFHGAANLRIEAEDVPDLSEVTDMSNMFRETSSLNNSINNWDVSNVENMSGLFYQADSFNQPLDNWDVSNVTDMSEMFWGTNDFNQPLNQWDVSSVTTMRSMFTFAQAFDQPLNNWDVSAVTDMSGMFSFTISFNGLIADWDVSAVTNMSNMFADAEVFNSSVGLWNVSNVEDMEEMFFRTREFNFFVNSWDVSSVTTMRRMFLGASSFNDYLGNWDISNVTDMFSMLSGTNLNINNFDFTLKAWSELSTVPENISFGASDLTYCNTGLTAINFLENTKGWTISGATAGSSAECN